MLRCTTSLREPLLAVAAATLLVGVAADIRTMLVEVMGTIVVEVVRGVLLCWIVVTEVL